MRFVRVWRDDPMRSQRHHLQSTTAVVAPVRAPVEPEAVGVAEAAACAGFSRTLIYEALSPESAEARGWPVLPSILLGGRRLIRLESLRKWLADLEQRAS
jgi:hypothetical protein